MKHVSSATVKITLSNYKWIIEKFLPFVLVRCVRYTNSKRIAETIAVYTFVASYYLARMPENKGLVAIVIGCMTDVVGEDLGNGPDTRNGTPLFKRQDDLRFAKGLAYLKIEQCLSAVSHYGDLIACNIEQALFERITATVMDYLKGVHRKQN